MTENPTISQIIAGMPTRFQPEAAKGMDIVLQFRLSGEQGEDFYADIANDACELKYGIHPEPTLTLRMSDQTYIDIVMGRLTGQAAFFKRKLFYQGPISLVIKLHKFFKPPDFLKH